MKIGITTLNLCISTTFNGDNTPLTDTLQILNDYNIRFVELGSNHSYSKNFAKIVKRFNFQYLVHNYFPIPKESFVLNIASSNNNIYQQSIKHIQNAIDFCEEINAKLYTFHPGFLTDPVGSNSSKKNYDFQWDSSKLRNSKYIEAYDRMLKALDKCVKYAQKRQVKIAIETEGSYYKKDHLLMQYPLEYTRFKREFGPADIGINLNLGHLYLALKAYGFSIDDFLHIVEKYLVAMELSHNNGIEDQHLPLQPDGWYWPIILDPCFYKTFKILEVRNTEIKEVVRNMNLIKRKINAI